MKVDEAIQRLTDAKELTFFGRAKLCEAIDVAINALETKPKTCSTCRWWKPYYDVMICKRYGDSHDFAGYEFCSKWTAKEEVKYGEDK